jgi:hypothetical protein
MKIRHSSDISNVLSKIFKLVLNLDPDETSSVVDTDRSLKASALAHASRTKVPEMSDCMETNARQTEESSVPACAKAMEGTQICC